MEPYFSNKLTDRQIEVIAHTMAMIGSDTKNFHFLESQQLVLDRKPIDLAVFEPTEVFDYYIAQTVGLSEYEFGTNFSRSELIMVLPKTWKPYFGEKKYSWPTEMLLDIAYRIAEGDKGVKIGQVFVPNGDEKGFYSNFTDKIGAIVTFAEEFPPIFYNEEIEGEFVNFFQLVPISKTDLGKIDEMGPIDFIRYELHNTEGAQFVVDFKEKELEGIDRLIKENEEMLRGKKDN